MPFETVNDVQLFWQQTGDAGEPLVLVHGSWTDHHTWDLVAPLLARSFRVLTYDRRGHSRSQRLPGTGSIQEDVADLAALLERLGHTPAHLVGGSFGGSIALRLAAAHPEVCRSVLAHEPPLFRLLLAEPGNASDFEAIREKKVAVLELLASGDNLAGARQFIETIAMGPGAWDQLPATMRETLVFNAPTFADEASDPESFNIDVESLRNVQIPAVLTLGGKSPSYFEKVVGRLQQALPQATTHTFRSSGHVPHVSHPREFADVITSFARHHAIRSEES